LSASILSLASRGRRIIDVKKVTSSLANYIYEPDNFPVIIYKHNGRISCLIFASGKVVIAGVKSEDQLNNIADEIAKML
jgi:TATA-box binding protein (TBP) (component of TFIID and TFIIIB)